MVCHVILRVRRAAIDAPEIAAVGDRDAQVGNLAAVFVEERHLLSFDACGTIEAPP
jgi:hypothetical protein